MLVLRDSRDRCPLSLLVPCVKTSTKALPMCAVSEVISSSGSPEEMVTFWMQAVSPSLGKCMV